MPSEIMLAFTTRCPGRTARTAGPDLDDLAGELVAEHGAGLEARRQAVEGEEVGAADRRRPHRDDRVAGLEDRRLGHLVDADVAGALQDDGPHAGCSISTR